MTSLHVTIVDLRVDGIHLGLPISGCAGHAVRNIVPPDGTCNDPQGRREAFALPRAS